MDEKAPPFSPDVLSNPFWSMSPEEVFRVLGSSPDGLSDEEVFRRLSLFGKNSLEAAPRLQKTKIFLNQFKSPLILALIFAGGLTAILGEFVDSGVIFLAVFVNTFLGFWQENKAETVLELLRSYIRTRVRVKRGGSDKEIDAVELVPGDVFRIARGDRIPADARIFYTNRFQADESVLTGESLPEEKDARSLPAATVVGDRTSVVFGGTLAVEGVAEAVVTGTGLATEFGKISKLIRERERAGSRTPLQTALGRFSLWVGMVLAFLIATLFFIGIVYHYDPVEMFLISVAVAVSAVPEGLPIALTVILAVGVERLSKKKAVVRKLLAAETMGSTSIILTDKTGTLTEARMEVRDVIPWGGDGSEEKKREILESALFHSDAILENPEEEVADWRIGGNPTEIAVIRAAARAGISYDGFAKQFPLTERLPFDPKRKFAAVSVVRKNGSEFILFGAPDVLLGFVDCEKVERERALALIEERAFKGERVLGVIVKPHMSSAPSEFEKLASFSLDASSDGVAPRVGGYRLLGFIALHDPLRPGVKDAIWRIGRAGVKTVIVTGDHPGTAEAIARELGMIDGRGAVLTGDDLMHLSKEELRARRDEVSVYARVTPEQKVLLVNMYKEKGNVVAVTGDGVNDAPALETADIGIAVGSGTDVTKSVADLIILDDNYETIVEAISEGRRILDNIQKVIVYLLSNSLDALLIIGGSIIAGVAMPLTALQILFVNFFSDSFPAIAFAFETDVDDIGARPRRLHRNLFDNEMKVLILIIGVPTSLLLFVLYYFLLRSGFPADLVRTFIFAAFATYTLILSFSLRSLKKSIFEYNPFSNLYLFSGVGIGLALTFLAVYVPVLQNIFDTVPLPAPWLGAVFLVGLFNIAAVEAGKLFFRNRNF